MADKDAAEKILESYNDVFSDIVNVLLFGGREVISANALEDQPSRSHYKADGKIREIERDVVKRWKKGNICVACIGFENQTSSDPDMPLRVIGYDGAEYRAQLLSNRTAKNRYPVVTLVLYFGYKERWKKPFTLKERLKIPPEFDPYINDYKINLFEIAYLTSEQIELFQSDFRIVADYFFQKRKNGNYIPSTREIHHVQETLQLLSVMTGDYRFEEAYDHGKKGEQYTMCEVLDRIENRGRERGILEGKLEAKREMALSLHSMGMSAEKIAEAAHVSIELVQQWLSQDSDSTE